ncbi:MAG: hypothetical protein JWP08_1804 [Bryobacterales bacterium]|nr:hypothetical protein [Bryobacterales bacterium]
MQQHIIDPTNPRPTAESTGDTWRLFLKALIKTGLLVVRNIQAMGQRVYSEANKVVAEAKAELDREKKPKTGASDLGESN